MTHVTSPFPFSYFFIGPCFYVLHDLPIYDPCVADRCESVHWAQMNNFKVLPHMRTLDQGQTQQGDWTLST
jgi:hypothetical protein